MTITAPVIITKPKKSYRYNTASLLSTSESSLPRKTQILPRRDSLQQLLFVTVGNFTAYASFSRKIHSNKPETATTGFLHK
jgi:hypothetical protein